MALGNGAGVVIVAVAALAAVGLAIYNYITSDSNQQQSYYNNNNNWRPAAVAEAVPCSICLEPISYVEREMLVPCNHSFHKKCVQMLRQSSADRRCPLCRRSFR